MFEVGCTPAAHLHCDLKRRGGVIGRWVVVRRFWCWAGNFVSTNTLMRLKEEKLTGSSACTVVYPGPLTAAGVGRSGVFPSSRSTAGPRRPVMMSLLPSRLFGRQVSLFPYFLNRSHISSFSWFVFIVMSSREVDVKQYISTILTKPTLGKISRINKNDTRGEWRRTEKANQEAHHGRRSLVICLLYVQIVLVIGCCYCASFRSTEMKPITNSKPPS